MKPPLFSIDYTKSFVVKSHSTVTSTPNLVESCSMLRSFLWDVSISKHRMWQNIQNLLKFLPQHPCMISSHHDKFHNFQTLFVFLKFLTPYGHTFVVKFSEQDVQNSFSFHSLSLKQGWIIWISNFYLFCSIIKITCISNLTWFKNYLKCN